MARLIPRTGVRWRPLFALALVVGGGLAFYLSSNHLAPILSYRLADEQTLVITAGAGAATWTRLGRVVETDAAVQVLVESLDWPVPRTMELRIVDFTVVLADALGDRAVLDGSGAGVPLVEPGGE